MYDRDVSSVSYFWKTLWKLFEIRLKFSLTIHPQSDCQTLSLNITSCNLLRCLVHKFIGSSDLHLPTFGSAYCRTMSKTIKKSHLKLFMIIILSGPLIWQIFHHIYFLMLHLHSHMILMAFMHVKDNKLKQ